MRETIERVVMWVVIVSGVLWLVKSCALLYYVNYTIKHGG